MGGTVGSFLPAGRHVNEKAGSTTGWTTLLLDCGVSADTIRQTGDAEHWPEIVAHREDTASRVLAIQLNCGPTSDGVGTMGLHCPVEVGSPSSRAGSTLKAYPRAGTPSWPLRTYGHVHEKQGKCVPHDVGENVWILRHA